MTLADYLVALVDYFALMCALGWLIGRGMEDEK